MKYLLSILLLFTATFAFSQIGGDNTYEFLNLPTSARITGMGGEQIAVIDNDVAFAFRTPSLLNASMHKNIVANHAFYAAGVNFGTVGYAHHIKKWKTTLQGGVQYVTYGEFNTTNVQGDVVGHFSTSEYAILLGAGYQYTDRISFGVNFKMITSQFEQYSSFGIASDWSATINDKSKKLAVSFVLKNIGTQISSYTSENNKEDLPFDVQLGFTKQFKHLPLRLGVVLHNLHRWDILYDDPNAEAPTLLFGEEQQSTSKFGELVDKGFRHVVFNGEFLFGKAENFRIRFGYNHLRRAELTVENVRGLAGISLGVGMKIRKFRIDFGRNFSHLSGGITHFGLGVDIGEYKKK